MIFFGGFYDVFDYLVSLASGTMLVDGEPVAWESDPEAVGHMRQILEAKGATHLLSAFDAESREEAERVVRSAPEWGAGGAASVQPFGSHGQHQRAHVRAARSGRSIRTATSSHSGCAMRCHPSNSTTSCCRMPFSTPSSNLA